MSSDLAEIDIVDAIPEDIESVKALLQVNNLTCDGISDYFEYYLVLKSDQTILGVCGLEIYGIDGLLRSLAIAPSLHKKGLGSTLLDVMLDKARMLNLHTIYLLTNTTEKFYHKHGFKSLSRDNAPESIKRSQEFAHLCPVSSVFMKKDI